jgi:hypothetical protein
VSGGYARHLGELPSFGPYALTYDDGTLIPELVTGTVVKFHARRVGATVAAVDRAGGDRLGYRPHRAPRLDHQRNCHRRADIYEGEFQVTYPDGKDITVPTQDAKKIPFEILARLA